jgi:DNA-binding winged helix-turn-helix (wHTH) protein
MKFVWELDPKYQVLYYIRQCAQIQEGFFQRIRAVVLPYYREDAWFLPDYDLFNDSKFVKELHALREHINKNMDSSIADSFFSPSDYLVSTVADNLDQIITETEISKDKANFEKIENRLTQFIQNTFPLADKIKSIHIIPTKFGTGGSYYHQIDEDGSQSFIITYRIDKGIESVVKSITSRFITTEGNFKSQNYSEWVIRQGICDFFFMHTKVKDLFSEHTLPGTLNFLKAYKGDLAIESAKYYAKLGYPIKSCFSIEESNITYNNEPLVGLDNKEIEVLKKLIENSSRIVDFDSVAKAYWGEEKWLDKYSLYSLAKVIEKLRKSFQKNSIPEHILMTVRKRGYMLYD